MPQEKELKNKKTCLPARFARASARRAGREKPVFYKTIGLAWELGYLITIPLVTMAFLGRFLDKRYEASPIFLLSGIILAIIVSGILVFRKTKKIIDDIK